MAAHHYLPQAQPAGKGDPNQPVVNRESAGVAVTYEIDDAACLLTPQRAVMRDASHSRPVRLFGNNSL